MYYIRYAARCRYDGTTAIHSADTKEDLQEVIKIERKECKEYHTYFEVEERFPSVYRLVNGVNKWVCDCADLKHARRIAKALNFIDEVYGE